jgi:hypothetical protein
MGIYKKAVRRVAQLLRNAEIITAETHVSRRDQMRPANLIAVKDKLGPGFLRGTITPASRRSRIAALTVEEREIARRHGWIR